MVAGSYVNVDGSARGTKATSRHRERRERARKGLNSGEAAAGQAADTPFLWLNQAISKPFWGLIFIQNVI